MDGGYEVPNDQDTVRMIGNFARVREKEMVAEEF